MANRTKKCRECGERFKPSKASDKLCCECRELIAVGVGNKSIIEFEKLRAAYNRRHNTSLTYGQFERYIQNIYMRSKAK